MLASVSKIKLLSKCKCFIDYSSVRHMKRVRRPTIRTYTEEEAKRLHERKLGDRNINDVPDGNRSRWADFEKQTSLKINTEKRKSLIDEGKFVLPEHIRFTQLRKGDTYLSKLTIMAKQKARKRSEKLIFLEGSFLIEEAFKAGVTITDIFFSKIEHLQQLPLDSVNSGERDTINFFKVNYDYLKLWSDVAVPSGLIAITEMPSYSSISSLGYQSLPVTLLCDNIRDSGNMGTLVRTAVAFGCKRVIAMKGCCDMWDTKTLRSGTGAHFYIPIYTHVEWSHIRGYIPPQSSVYLTDIMNTNQTEALHPRALKHVHEKLAHVPTADVHTEIDQQTGESHTIDDSYNDAATVSLYKQALTESTPYTSPQYTSVLSDPNKAGATRDGASPVTMPSPEVVVIVGGEVQGASAEAHKLTYDYDGCKIYVPMVEWIHSLNAAVATGVVLSEIKRQFDMHETQNIVHDNRHTHR